MTTVDGVQMCRECGNPMGNSKGYNKFHPDVHAKCKEKWEARSGLEALFG